MALVGSAEGLGRPASLTAERPLPTSYFLRPIAFCGPLAKMAPFLRNRDIMRGQVLGVDTRTGDGIVSGEDGRRYAFRPADWAARGEPAVGMEVDFEVHENRALTIFPVPGATASTVPAAFGPEPDRSDRNDRNDRNKLIAALLAFLVGPLGIHRFYLGRVGSGIVMLLLSCTVIGLFATVPWALIDMIRYLVMTEGDFAERYARS